MPISLGLDLLARGHKALQFFKPVQHEVNFCRRRGLQAFLEDQNKSKVSSEAYSLSRAVHQHLRLHAEIDRSLRFLSTQILAVSVGPNRVLEPMRSTGFR
jgi:hypothetical protein